MPSNLPTLWASLRDRLKVSSRLQWAEPAAQEVLVERAAVRLAVRMQIALAAPASETHQRAEVARHLLRVTVAMSNQQRMLFNDLPQVFHWG